MAISVRSLLSLASRAVRAVSAPAAGDRHEAPRRPAPGHQAADRRKQAVLAYSPSADGNPDPGEIVWTWVPYEDDPHQGKDRPVLLIGTEGRMLLGLMLTSRDRNNSGGRDERYVDIGAGAWDRQGRPSEVRIDRLLRVEPADVRREGAVLPRGLFEQVVAAVPEHLLG